MHTNVLFQAPGLDLQTKLSKMASRTLPGSLRGPPADPREAQDGPKRRQERPETAPRAAKSAPRAARRRFQSGLGGHLGPMWSPRARLQEASLAPRGSILDPPGSIFEASGASSGGFRGSLSKAFWPLPFPKEQEQEQEQAQAQEQTRAVTRYFHSHHIFHDPSCLPTKLLSRRVS